MFITRALGVSGSQITALGAVAVSDASVLLRALLRAEKGRCLFAGNGLSGCLLMVM
jgi:hypothetical protein